MGNVICSLFERLSERSLVPHYFIHKHNHYGVNNLPYSEATADASPVYRMKHFSDDIFNSLSHVYYYRTGDTVSNLRALCKKRGDAPALAYRPVDHVETLMIPDPHQAPVPAAGGEVRKTPRYVVHYRERVVMSYVELWSSIEHFGIGLSAFVDHCHAVLGGEGRRSRLSTTAAPTSSADATRPPTKGAIGGGGVNMTEAASDDESTSHIPARPVHDYQRTPVRGMSAPKIAIFADTRWEWITTIFGLWTQRYVAVTVYANLGEEAVACALEEAGCEAIVCHGKSVPVLFQLMKKGRLPWSGIAYLDDLPEDYVIPMGTEEGRRFSELLTPWSSLLVQGAAAPLAGAAYSPPQTPESNDHLALVMYTSGTTGKPKGVMHTHGSIVAGVQTLNDKLVWIEPRLPKEDQTYCAFLPLAHIMEFICINIFLHRGFLVCFSNPRTLTNEFAWPHGDFEEYKPLIIMAVPRIFDVLRKSVIANLPPPGTLKRRIFNQAFASRQEALKRGYDTPFYNAKVFSKIRAAFGGRMVLMLSGGGVLSEATHEFVNVAMGLIVEGYGLTETNACGATQMIGSLHSENVGELMKSCEIKLQDTEHYKHTDKPEPRGEILLRGPFLFKGYYKQPELTREALDGDGWFHTGDVGSIAVDNNNVLRVVGRLKALAKNVTGEYIPMEALEAIYAGNELSLPNSTCLLVHPLRRYVCALALTEEKHVASFLAHRPELAAKVDTVAYPDILKDPVFQDAAAESFRKTATDAKRRPFELVRHVRLLNDEWTAENGMLTAALKLKRMHLEVVYQDVIADLFKDEAEEATSTLC